MVSGVSLSRVSVRFSGWLLIGFSLFFLLVPFFPLPEFKSTLAFQFSTTLTVISLIVGLLMLSGITIRNVKWLALTSILGSLSAMLRIPFAVLPSVQPCTFIVICAGYALGPAAGFLTGTITAIVSNLFLGHGLWTIYQILGWGLAGVVASILKKFNLNANRLRLTLTVFGFVWGYVFGVITNLSFWIYFYEPSLTSFIAVQIASFWFDTVHALNNAVFLAILGPKTVNLLEKLININKI